MPSSDLIADVEREGPEPVGAPLRAVAVISRETGQALAPAEDPLGLRRRRSAATRAARAALSFAASTHAAFGDRPSARSAWKRALRALRERDAAADDPRAACAQALGRVAGLALLLPAADEGEEWQASAIAFADDGTLEELHGACLDLAAAVLAVGRGV